MTRVLLTGAGGQVAREIQATSPPSVDVVALGRDDLDICDMGAIAGTVVEHRPTVIINAAAYTAVDQAESEPELAYRVNADGAANLAMAASQQECRMIHISTDFVFDGESTVPYLPDAETGPLSVYGASKLQGEMRVQEILGKRALIVRSAWIYSVHGHNFVKTMLRLMRERDELSVVSDQRGSPTWARNLARAIWAAVDRETLHGCYHCTDGGITSWHGFAEAIQTLGLEAGLLTRVVPIHEISTAGFPVPATRPAFSALDCTGTERDFGWNSMPWRDALREMLKELAG